MRHPSAFTYRIDALPPVPPVLQFIQRHAAIDKREAYGNLNMGAGFALFVADADAERAVEVARSQGTDAWIAGRVTTGPKQVIIDLLPLTSAPRSARPSVTRASAAVAHASRCAPIATASSEIARARLLSVWAARRAAQAARRAARAARRVPARRAEPVRAAARPAPPRMRAVPLAAGSLAALPAGNVPVRQERRAGSAEPAAGFPAACVHAVVDERHRSCSRGQRSRLYLSRRNAIEFRRLCKRIGIVARQRRLRSHSAIWNRLSDHRRRYPVGDRTVPAGEGTIDGAGTGWPTGAGVEACGDGCT